jgi:hypothetical protein
MKLNLIPGGLLSLLLLSFVLSASSSCNRQHGREQNKKSYLPVFNEDTSGGLLRHVTDYEIITGKKPLVFPVPSDIQMGEGIFNLDGSAFILTPEKKSNTDEFLAGLLLAELSDKYEQPIEIISKSKIPENGKFILMGDITNPLIKNYCRKNELTDKLVDLGEEGYILKVTEENIIIAAVSHKGALYGFESLRQIINRQEGRLLVPQLLINDSPQFPFRGIKLYLPGRENIPFFKRFIRDFAAKYKFNKIILELNANMRLYKHPELNTGTVLFERHLNFSRLDRPPGLHNEFQNSSHQDNADGEILEKEEVAEIVSYMRKFNIEVIPELPSLTHAYYLLFGHEDLAENINQPFPDTYCPLKPEIYKIYFDVLDEYIDVIKPAVIHVGHDEWRMEKDVCELCRGKDYGKLFAEDLTRIHDYLAGKEIRTAIWGDHLLESVRSKDHQVWKSSTGYQYNIPGALTPEQVRELVPEDILIFNWFFNKPENDKQISDFGFQQVYGNFTPDIKEWNNRINTKGLIGGAPSSWAATTETNFGKDQLIDFMGCANLLWSKHYLSMDKLVLLTEPFVNKIYNDFRGRILPGDAGSRVRPVNISSYRNSSMAGVIDSLKPEDLITGIVKAGNKVFNLDYTQSDPKKAIVVSNVGKSGSASAQGIEIDKDVNSILFLHTSAREGRNARAYTLIHNFDETSELLGWYEVVFEDGFIETVPIRYGMNILDWRWKKRVMNNEASKVRNSQNHYAYMASAVDCSGNKSGSVSFFAYEWENTRPGKTVKEINLKASESRGKNENAIILLAVSITENPKLINSTGDE